jgi:glycine dehydrogenase subunit 1
MATREEFVRQLPGRITGETIDKDGRLAYVLTLRGREQDIRRARANSNICTNQALTALAATVYTALMGPDGLREVAELSIFKAHYLARRLQASGFRLQVKCARTASSARRAYRLPAAHRRLSRVLLPEACLMSEA